MTSFMLLLVNFTKTQKFRYLEKRNIIFSSNKKIINDTSRVTSWQQVISGGNVSVDDFLPILCSTFTE